MDQDCDALEIYEDVLIEELKAALANRAGKKKIMYPFKPLEWTLLDSKDELMTLPLGSNDFVVTWYTFGSMHQKSGKLLFTINVSDNNVSDHTAAQQRLVCNEVRGKPGFH